MLTPCSNTAQFQGTIQSIAAALADRKNRLLVNDRLEVVQKWGFKWRLLCFLNFFCCMIGWDLYASVRAGRVARQLLQFCEENRGFFQENSVLREMVQKGIIQKLAERTKKHEGAIDRVAAQIKGLFSTSCLKWPSKDQLTTLGITEGEMRVADYAINDLFRRVKEANESKIVSLKVKAEGHAAIHCLQHQDAQGNLLIGYQVPFRVSFQKVDGQVSVFLISKKVVLEDGDIIGREAFDLTEGLPYLKQTITRGGPELQLYQYSQSHTFKRDVGDKLQILVPRHYASLANFLGSEQMQDPSVVISIVRDLLSGLEKLHSTKVNLHQGQHSVENVPTYHGDVKLHAARIFQNGSKFTAAWTGFALAAQVFRLAGTPGYQSPEYVALIAKYQQSPRTVTLQEIVQHHCQHGQQRDLWAMGILILLLIRNQRDGAFPLQCLIDALERSKNRKSLDLFIKDLKQETINQQLAALEAATEGPFGALFTVVKGLLKVNPDARMPAREALEILLS